uniref:Uncharacterized protein n=1 Tax=Arundo donax TaxID=35708 RepID=A0A0A8ZAC3_ARUDO
MMIRRPRGPLVERRRHPNLILMYGYLQLWLHLASNIIEITTFTIGTPPTEIREQHC